MFSLLFAQNVDNINFVSQINLKIYYKILNTYLLLVNEKKKFDYNIIF